MPTNINFNKTLGIASKGASIVLPTSTFEDTTSWFGDGVDDQLLSTSNFGSIDNGTQFSWSFWFKLDSLNSNQTLIRLNTNTSTQGFHVFYRSITSGNAKLEAFVEGSSSNWTRTPTFSVAETNKWYHVCVTLDNTDPNRYARLKIYLDGVYQGASNFFGANMGTGTNLSFLSNIDGSLPANANINEIACWGQGTVLTATQVLEIFNKGLANDLNNLPTAPAPTNWWRSETAEWNGATWTLTDVNASFEMRSQNMVEANRENDVPSLFSNKSFTFDGVDDYIDCGNPTSLQITGALALSAWVKTTDTSSYEIIIGKDNVSSGTRSYLFYRLGNNLSFAIWKSNSLSDVTGTAVINDGNWHHVMGVNDGTDLRIYVDGILDNTNVGGGGTFDNGTFNFNIGRRGGTSSQRGYFTGTIDEVAVWNSDQSANIISIFNQGVPTSLESLSPISHWRMGEDATWNGSQWTLNDNGSGGNNGTSQNMVLASRINDTPT